MDRISSLPDDLILKIVSFPRTEVAITTSLLSKGWRDVWKHVPKLEYYQRGLGGSVNTCKIIINIYIEILLQFLVMCANFVFTIIHSVQRRPYGCLGVCIHVKPL
uniref:F-box domain-containing protein n=1 Tax=Brassica oleracea TaxID=3712 RepID=A0A3P6CUD0_BRAOL|nr:unnamed protein product [Brassica oleracea]